MDWSLPHPLRCVLDRAFPCPWAALKDRSVSDKSSLYFFYYFRSLWSGQSDPAASSLIATLPRVKRCQYGPRI
jgi:hypothetical protein